MGNRVDEIVAGQKRAYEIEQLGWHVLLIHKDDREPSLAYSVGLFKTFGHPEIAVFGSDLEVMHKVIDLMGDKVRKGRHFSDGESVPGIIEDYEVHLYKVPRHFYADREDFAYARRFYEGAEFSVLQCFWPDLRVCCP
jgi:Domain of unknown function (DUF4262)